MIERSADYSEIGALPGHRSPNHTEFVEHFEWNDIYQGTTADYQPPDAQLLEIVDGLRPGRALDVGCGAGGLAVALAERGWRVTGIDLAPNAVVAAQAVAAERGVTATFEAADASTWKPDHAYDLVISSFALPDNRALRVPAFAMMRNALVVGGTVLIKDFDAAMARLPEFGAFELVTLEELERAFAGLDVVRSEIAETPAHHEAAGDGPWTAAVFQATKPAH